MTLDQFRPHVKVYFDPLVRFAIRCRITPNVLTIAAFVASAVAGILFFFRLETLGGPCGCHKCVLRCDGRCGRPGDEEPEPAG